MLILSTVFYDMGHTRDGAMKTRLQNFHIIFLNSNISVKYLFNLYKISGECCLMPSQGKRASNFDLGSGYLFMLFR